MTAQPMYGTILSAVPMATNVPRSKLTKDDASLCYRLVFNDAATYDPATKTGGFDGSIVMPEELSRPENKMLEPVVKRLAEVRAKIWLNGVGKEETATSSGCKTQPGRYLAELHHPTFHGIVACRRRPRSTPRQARQGPFLGQTCWFWRCESPPSTAGRLFVWRMPRATR